MGIRTIWIDVAEMVIHFTDMTYFVFDISTDSVITTKLVFFRNRLYRAVLDK